MIRLVYWLLHTIMDKWKQYQTMAWLELLG